MKSLHFYIQAMLFAAVLLILLGSIIFNEILFYVLYFQFFIGVYQYVTGTWLLLRRKYVDQLRYYWLISTLDLLILVGSTYTHNSISGFLMAVFFFVVPWPLAIYYLMFSYQIHEAS